jgi:hypothetical protein
VREHSRNHSGQRPIMRFALSVATLLSLPCCTPTRQSAPQGQQRTSDATLRELFDSAHWPLLRPGVQAAGFSSYDRSGGNDDGFQGTYSKLRIEDGNSVIAEMAGPGVIQRIWTTHSQMESDGLLGRMGEHIRIYIDGNLALDVPFETLFDDSLARFPKPVAGAGLGGFYSYVPIPYSKSCKVVIDGLAVRFYQINYSTFPNAQGLRPFSSTLTADQRGDLSKAVQRWSDPLSITRGDEVETFTTVIDQGVLESSVGSSDPSPSLVLGVTFEGELGDADIEVQGTGDDSAAVRLPLTMFFGAGINSGPYASLLMGNQDNFHYNLLPFYSHGPFSYTIRSTGGVKGTLRAYAITIGDVPANAGRLSAQLNHSPSTTLGTPHILLQAEGSGHYIGTYAVTQGPEGLPSWLEGDDVWTLDGALRIHGTGTEDYFNGGWYAVENRLDHPGAFPTHGFPDYGATDGQMRAAAYRWHVADPVPFSTSIKAEIERGDQNRAMADYRSLGWYYAR